MACFLGTLYGKGLLYCLSRSDKEGFGISSFDCTKICNPRAGGRGGHVMVMFLQNLFYKQLSALQGFIMNKNEESAFFRKEVQG